MLTKVLVTGGAGYIGSHTTLALLQAGLDVTVLDNFCNSSPVSLERVALLAGRKPKLIRGDIRDSELLNHVFRNEKFSAILHFAAFKSVSESISKPLEYYDNNVGGSITLMQAAARAGVFRFVFSSSATVYGTPAHVPLTEDSPLSESTNPYGRSKLIIENILRDAAQSDSRWRIALLRYFNPAGAHESGLMGEDSRGTPNNLLPYISQVAIGKQKKLRVFGGNYPTRDGTGVRDYIHVMDLAEGHIKALHALKTCSSVNEPLKIWNLGTGNGVSVFEMIEMFEEVSGRPIPYEILDRRAGDVAECWADPRKAFCELNWIARRGLKEMLTDTWNWQLRNPNGYQ